jgi:peptidoglycan-associated lipoprotein
MLTITRVSLALGALALLSAGCATHSQPPRTAEVATTPTAATPPAPTDAVPTPSALTPDAATGEPERTVEFTVSEELPDVHFASGHIQVQWSDRKALDAAAAWLHANPAQLVIIEGYTDGSGPRAANLALAHRRAKWVMDYLVARGVQPGRITVVSRGEDGTLCAQKSAACQARNRRVHFLVRESSPPQQISAQPNP